MHERELRFSARYAYFTEGEKSENGQVVKFYGEVGRKGWRFGFEGTPDYVDLSEDEVSRLIRPLD